MKTAVYFCSCGGNISGKIDAIAVEEKIAALYPEIHFKSVDFLCSEEGKEALENDLREHGAERVVIGACTPREHESTFMRALSNAGLNPYFMQMVNLREHVAWVTEDPREAESKAVRLLGAAIRRVALHEPLHRREIDICPDALVIGAGPAGLKAALGMAAAGRKVTVVEKTPVIGGMPVRYEELFPSMECGPCVLEPLLGEVLHGDLSGNIEVLTLSQVEEVVGSYGNFTVKIRQGARHVDLSACIGCAECIGPCPVSAPNEFDYGMSERKAVSMPFTGGLPNVPSIDGGICLRLQGGECNKCVEACPVEGVIRFDDSARLIERRAGAIVTAVGGDSFDCRDIPNLGYGKTKDIYTASEFERLLASNGPTGGEIMTSSGKPPRSVAIVHCVGSLDTGHMEYCSGICCQYAFKFNHLVGKKVPGARQYHFYKEISSPGKEESVLYRHAKEDRDTEFLRYRDIDDLELKACDGEIAVRLKDPSGSESKISADIVILCPASVPPKDGESLGSVLDTDRDRFGFFEELDGTTDSVQSKIKGIYIAGACQAPTDIRRAMNQGMAAAGYVLSGLVPGRKLEISPVNASVDGDRCSGCRVCVAVCPYKAISFDDNEGTSSVNDVLCLGCGTCVAACPSGAIKGNHFTTEEIMAEIEGILS